ncbi:MAG: SNF2-related protein [Thermodesulfobacteriota bacterium]
MPFWYEGNRPGAPGQSDLQLQHEEGGLAFSARGCDLSGDVRAWWLDPGQFRRWELVALLGQLVDEGLAAPSPDGSLVLLGWEDLFQVLASPDYPGVDRLLGLPPSANLTMALSARGSVADPEFAVHLEWRDARNRPLGSSPTRLGAIITVARQQYLLPARGWRLAEAVHSFHRRSERSQAAQEREWARLRRLATEAGARLDHYLERTVILTADRLDLGLRRVDVGETAVVEVTPRVREAPDHLWLTAFDRFNTVQEHYDLLANDGSLIRVLVEPDARAVLTEIKRLPGRRVAGARAEAFVRNPYALLGEAMATVVPPAAFEAARDEAGILFYDFHCTARREADGRIQALHVTPQARDASSSPLPDLELADRASARAFADTLDQAIGSRAPCFRWAGRTLELRGDSVDHLRQVRAWLCSPWVGEPLVSWNGLLDLSRYAERVDGVGAHRPQYVPYLVAQDQRGPWLPESLEEAIVYTAPNGETVLAPTGTGQLAALRQWLAAAPAPEDHFTPRDWPEPVSRQEAERLLDVLGRAKAQPPAPPAPSPPADGSPEAAARAERQTILIKQNVLQLDHLESRAERLAFAAAACQAEIPGWLRPEMPLKEHQRVGLAWLQHLWRHRTSQGVRGALLADDMGLGKTLQLLAFIAWHLEKESHHALPALVVAPVSLLDNWRQEIDRFFDPRLGQEVLPLYGALLRERKLTRHEMSEVAGHGVRGLLRPGWRHDKRLVLTTYETLRDLEISLAQEPWSIVVCDEAQKIKTPGALMTHAAKAQNALFRIACTGTPVENSLADLWCLFDFIQPGLLAALSTFCRAYRRPIETKSEDERARLDELRRLIEPQVLRRLKDDIADLPPRQVEETGKRLPLSTWQRQLYGQAVAEARGTAPAATAAPRANTAILGLLHRLRSICAEPREPGTAPDLRLPMREHCARSPKLDWLLRELEAIRQRQEKAIVFTEFRDLQRALQHRIRERFGFSPAIVNGSTRTGEDAGEQSRQRLIDSFQTQSGFGVIILSTTAIGFGVNIQGANHVIHFTRAWNPAKEDQATDRTHRLGQTRTVHVYYPTVHADDFETFEVKLDALLERKRALARDMLNGAAEIAISEWAGLRAPNGGEAVPRTRLTTDLLARLDPQAFERLCRQRLERDGYTASLTRPTGDCGVDVVAFRGWEGVLVQCKSSVQERALGWEAVRDVVAGAGAYRRQYRETTFTLVAATNQAFNAAVADKARQHEVQLWQQPEWVEWLDREPVYLDELD